MNVVLIGGMNDRCRISVDDSVKRIKMARKTPHPVYSVKNGIATEQYTEEVYILEKIATPNITIFIGVHEDITIEAALIMLLEQYTGVWKRHEG